MDLSKLDLFFAAANSRSFTQAAEKCNVAQTTVSKYIAQLEEELELSANTSLSWKRSSE